ncbi:unnamed protein product [Spodoptera exigua]|nr:unnamed protein product [Spodoptera exigua]
MSFHKWRRAACGAGRAGRYWTGCRVVSLKAHYKCYNALFAGMGTGLEAAGAGTELDPARRYASLGEHNPPTSLHQQCCEYTDVYLAHCLICSLNITQPSELACFHRRAAAVEREMISTCGGCRARRGRGAGGSCVAARLRGGTTAPAAAAARPSCCPPDGPPAPRADEFLAVINRRATCGAFCISLMCSARSP